MKTFQLIISLLLVYITASAVGGETGVVLDHNGDPVKTNTPYRVGREGTLGHSISSYTLEPENVSTEICSKGVAVFNKSMGPTSLSIVFVSSSDNVRVSTQLNIKFKILPQPKPQPGRRPSKPTRRPARRPNRRPNRPRRPIRPSRTMLSCTESMFWRVGQNNSHYEGLLILGGSESSNNSIFTIEKSNNFYKFAFGGADIGLDEESLTGMSRLRLLRDSDELGEFSFFPALL